MTTLFEKNANASLMPPPGGGLGFYPMRAASTDVTATTDAIQASDTYEALLIRWNNLITATRSNVNGLSIARFPMTNTTVGGRTTYYWEFEPPGYTHTVVLIGGLHGSEQQPPKILEELARLYMEDTIPALRQIRANTRVIIVPCANPDGYTANSALNGNGVNLNRNWGPGTNSFFTGSWDDYTGPVGANYKGASANSEIETTNIQTMFSTWYPDTTAILDIHNLGAAQDAAAFLPPPGNLGGLDAIVQWAAREAIGSSVVYYSNPILEKANIVPTIGTYFQGEGVWSGSVEIGPNSQIDITTAAGMATAINYFGNLLIGIASLPSMNYAARTQPRAASVLCNDDVSVTSATPGVELAAFTKEITVDFAGLAVANYSVTIIPSTTAGHFHYIAPYLGQNIAPYRYDTAALRLLEEQYVGYGGNANNRSVITLSALRPIYPSSINSAPATPLQFGIKAWNTGGGSYTIKRYQANVLLIPSSTMHITTDDIVGGTTETPFYPIV